jgi:hypothetical protein
MLKVKVSDPVTIGKTTKRVMTCSKPGSALTINDLHKIRDKIIRDNKKKSKDVQIGIMKVLSHQWMTFNSDEKYNAYFDSLVKDVSKFHKFSQAVFYVYTQ